MFIWAAIKQLCNQVYTPMTDILLKELTPNGVLTLTLNRPDSHNAFDDVLAAQIINALESAASDDAVRVVILAGAGKSFSAGGDANYMRRMGSNSFEDNLKDGGQLASLMKSLFTFPKPTIARVQGAAYGGGVGLVACCDIAVGGPRAKFCLSEVKLGMVPATISPYVIKAIGARAARRYFTTAEIIGGERALQLGLLAELVDEAELDNTIDGIVAAILNNGPNAVQRAKRLVGEVDGEISQSLIDDTVRCIAEIRDSDEGREGLTAFLEKRKPNWLAS